MSAENLLLKASCEELLIISGKPQVLICFIYFLGKLTLQLTSKKGWVQLIQFTLSVDYFVKGLLTDGIVYTLKPRSYKRFFKSTLLPPY